MTTHKYVHTYTRQQDVCGVSTGDGDTNPAVPGLEKHMILLLWSVTPGIETEDIPRKGLFNYFLGGRLVFWLAATGIDPACCVSVEYFVSLARFLFLVQQWASEHRHPESPTKSNLFRSVDEVTALQFIREKLTANSRTFSF